MQSARSDTYNGDSNRLYVDDSLEREEGLAAKRAPVAPPGRLGPGEHTVLLELVAAGSGPDAEPLAWASCRFALEAAAA